MAPCPQQPNPSRSSNKVRKASSAIRTVCRCLNLVRSLTLFRSDRFSRSLSVSSVVPSSVFHTLQCVTRACGCRYRRSTHSYIGRGPRRHSCFSANGPGACPFVQSVHNDRCTRREGECASDAALGTWDLCVYRRSLYRSGKILRWRGTRRDGC